MDVLEILKKDWKKKDHSFDQITEKEIYGMLHKRSSSIVKLIFIISVFEIVLWTVFGLFNTDEEYLKKLEVLHLKETIYVMTYINYGIVLLFIYAFYRNHKKISATDSIKKLMSSILNTRKTVKYYIWYNLAMIFISIMLFFIFFMKFDPKIIEIIDSLNEKMNVNGFYMISFTILFICSLGILGLFWLFYKLIYGVLLKRLNSNYEELEKLDL
ncbi:hypothetical protein [uncultured Flavobacterium sp.]|uniref:hypothetical protein n=1 Tax=uncultured Flavobacterium sp. TaxID=165435 RepID=UPI0030CA2C86